MTLEQKLDTVLKAITLAPTVEALKQQFPDNGNIKHHALIQILEKLRHDGYIIIADGNNEYSTKEPVDGNHVRRTLAGELFAKRIGYRWQKWKERFKTYVLVLQACVLFAFAVIGFFHTFVKSKGEKPQKGHINLVQSSKDTMHRKDTLEGYWEIQK